MAETSDPTLLSAQSMAASFESGHFRIGKGRLHIITIELSVTNDTHVGSFYVKHGNVPANIASWDTVVLDSVPTVAAGSAYHFTIEVESGADFFLLGYTRTGGDGAATAVAAIAER